ncbi:MAG: hypothetical protein AAF518_15810 [Spirochaetota bacterium]
MENPEGYIIGEGYVGSYFKNSHREWIGTHREVHSNDKTVIFDTMVRKTWKNLSQANCCLITCPLREGSDFVFKELLHFLKEHFSMIVLLSSTSVFLEKGSQQISINEESVLDPTKTQVKREEQLLSIGASVLTLSGIYGLNRSPLTWLQKNLVSNNKLFVNLIHVEDIVEIITRVFQKKIQGERYIVSDGQKHYWETIIEFCKEKGMLAPEFQRTKQKEPIHRYLSNKKLLKILPSDFTFQNLYQFLEIQGTTTNGET